MIYIFLKECTYLSLLNMETFLVSVIDVIQFPELFSEFNLILNHLYFAVLL